MKELDKLRWRCRRGTLELDLMLTRYLEQRYSNAPRKDQQTFTRLLELEDSELINYLMGEKLGPDAELTGMVAAIKAVPPYL